jgi:hypothetical protein
MRGIRHKVLEKLKAHKESFSADDVHRRQKEVRHLLTLHSVCALHALHTFV